MAQIDARYPRPPLPPLDAPLYRVTAVESSGRIVLEDGRALGMEGIDCSEEGFGYLSRLLLDEDFRVVLPATGGPPGQGSPEIWVADISTRQPGRSASYSLIVETALTSGWCRPNGAASERYRALAAMAKRRETLK